eukprot:CAMPEP_0206447236 /NCGR_PEP_ID=MMETSP0324_2-20121206/16657_1 /ASSEMBLY_ACC=CAM_ASM_000836 /TAXON_ID=2866 /ORGANISM="Crypthecodinium cohnii, Strain Seligo" /LENGTH=590 /DNA_ID=CAMNT_0053915951 /DNA_START=37 /DNA_END=1809 /DNA_ORIENTATION=+
MSTSPIEEQEPLSLQDRKILSIGEKAFKVAKTLSLQLRASDSEVPLHPAEALDLTSKVLDKVQQRGMFIPATWNDTVAGFTDLEKIRRKAARQNKINDYMLLAADDNPNLIAQKAEAYAKMKATHSTSAPQQSGGCATFVIGNRPEEVFVDLPTNGVDELSRHLEQLDALQRELKNQAKIDLEALKTLTEEVKSGLKNPSIDANLGEVFREIQEKHAALEEKIEIGFRAADKTSNQLYEALRRPSDPLTEEVEHSATFKRAKIEENRRRILADRSVASAEGALALVQAMSPESNWCRRILKSTAELEGAERHFDSFLPRVQNIFDVAAKVFSENEKTLATLKAQESQCSQKIDDKVRQVEQLEAERRELFQQFWALDGELEDARIELEVEKHNMSQLSVCRDNFEWTYSNMQFLWEKIQNKHQTLETSTLLLRAEVLSAHAEGACSTCIGLEPSILDAFEKVSVGKGLCEKHIEYLESFAELAVKDDYREVRVVPRKLAQCREVEDSLEAIADSLQEARRHHPDAAALAEKIKERSEIGSRKVQNMYRSWPAKYWNPEVYQEQAELASIERIITEVNGQLNAATSPSLDR